MTLARDWRTLAVVALLAVVSVTAVGSTAGTSGIGTEAETVDRTAPTETSVTFEDQTSAGAAVTVSEVSLPDGGFVAIHDGGLLNGSVVSSARGASEYLEPGVHEHVAVRLSEPIADSRQLVAVAYRDADDDGEYDFAASEGRTDGPYASDSRVVADGAFVTVDGAAETETRTVTTAPTTTGELTTTRDATAGTTAVTTDYTPRTSYATTDYETATPFETATDVEPITTAVPTYTPYPTENVRTVATTASPASGATSTDGRAAGGDRGFVRTTERATTVPDSGTSRGGDGSTTEPRSTRTRSGTEPTDSGRTGTANDPTGASGDVTDATTTVDAGNGTASDGPNGSSDASTPGFTGAGAFAALVLALAVARRLG